ncbi:hypothetical protein SAMN06265380_10177 [Ruegeria faecimaris]|uniref:ABC-three component systems C-terminal domain-containing protein n=2 Tax=Ruegeria faecimaris TaxID=686389 RepID=A0A521AEH6_9RHOB|nr:hypothetical protein SAMN06265380_10177 [Ruegeria faecimaris]
MAFQNLVNAVFQGGADDFQSIAPWGSAGDGGNDGYVRSSGHYLQVYGPKAGSNWSPAVAAKKSEDDFQKLLNKWNGLNRYSFVLNDRFQGVPGPVEISLQNIQKLYGVDADSIACAQLTDRFTDLKEFEMMEIVGGVPGHQPTFIDKRKIGELLEHLANKVSPNGLSSKGLAPDFDEKIEFNGLSDAVGARLRANSYQDADVTGFLNVRGQWLAEGIAQELRDLYAESKSTIIDLEDAADLRYVWMVGKVIPESAHAHPHSFKAFHGAAEVILAHFFEACDVYDKPETSSRTA